MSKPSLSRGFSLVELLVVVAIFIILTVVILFSQNRFSSDSALQNLAYQMGLAIRQAQVYGLSVRGSQPDSTATFDTAFGIHFDCSTPGSFLLFADLNKNGYYDPANDIIRQTYKLDSGNLISNIITSNGPENTPCATDEGYVLKADISFQRPNPEAIIQDSIHPGPPPIQMSRIEIDVTSGIKDKTKKIIVTQPGQIYITN